MLIAVFLHYNILLFYVCLLLIATNRQKIIEFFEKMNISGRYRGIRKPLAQRTESEYSVLYRIVLTWGLGVNVKKETISTIAKLFND